MSDFFQTLKITTPEDVFRLAAFLFAVLWVLWRLQARKARRREPGTAYVAPDHGQPHFMEAYEKKRHSKTGFSRAVDMAQLVVIFIAGAALARYLGLALYAEISAHRFYIGTPENLFRTGFFCGALCLMIFAIREFLDLLRR